MAMILKAPTKRTGEGMKTIEKRAKDEEVVAGDGSGIRKTTDEDEVVAGGDRIAKRRKRKMLGRYPKAYVEYVLRRGRPTPFRVWSEERLAKLRPERRAYIRAEHQELAALAQKKIDRYDQMKEQYPRTGYADIVLSDLEDDDIVEMDDLNWTDA